MKAVVLPEGASVLVDVAIEPCGCARCGGSESAPVTQPGGLIAMIPFERSAGAYLVVCLPCAALLIVEQAIRAGRAPANDVIAAVRAAAPKDGDPIR